MFNGDNMNSIAKLFLSLGAISGALGVMIGAFGAHGLKSKLSDQMLAVYQTGVQYQFYHTFALLAVGFLALKYQSGPLTSSGWSFLVGILLFSGSLYALSISGIKVLGAITPIGGLFFIVGWVLLLVGILKAA
jgi:uncharacterized membrane protein YgdD (TMEM256/DUF423 family)